MKYLSLIATFFLAGCSLSPEYIKPVNTGENKSYFIKENKEYSSYKWWESYESKQVNELMELMMKENQDILSYQKQVELNLKNYDLDKISIAPKIDFKDEMLFGGNPMQFSRFGLSISSYEIDYLGKIKEKLKMTNADLSIAHFNLEELKMMTSYNIMSNYLFLVKINTQIKLTDKRIANLKKMKEILGKNIEIGLKPAYMMIDLDTEISSELKSLHILNISKNDSDKLLKTYLGKDIDISIESLKEMDIDENMIASNQINKRFDIQEAEQLLIKENAKIGLVKAQYFPTLSLNAFYGGLRPNGGSIFGGSSELWSITPSLTVNLFDFGNIGIQVEKQKIEKEKVLYSYVKTVRMAFLEVKTNVLNYKEKKEELNSLKEMDKLSEQKYELTKKKFAIGLISEYDVLLEENAFLKNKMNLENSRIEKEVFLLNLRKSLQGKID